MLVHTHAHPKNLWPIYEKTVRVGNLISTAIQRKVVEKCGKSQTTRSYFLVLLCFCLRISLMSYAHARLILHHFPHAFVNFYGYSFLFISHWYLIHTFSSSPFIYHSNDAGFRILNLVRWSNLL